MVQHCIRCGDGCDHHWTMAQNADQVDPMTGERLRAPGHPCVTLATGPEIGPAFPRHVPRAWGHKQLCIRFYLTLAKL